jgi:hypothetical protein
MAAVAEVCQVISETLNVPRGTVDHLARRLGEAGLLPRGPRGRNAPHFGATHIARLLVGVMATAEGIYHTSASVVPAVKRIAELSQGGEARVDVYADGDLDDPQSSIMLVPAGSFVEVVAHRIRWTRIETNKDELSAIGLSFGGGNVYGWIEFDLGKTGINRVSNIRRVDFGITQDVLKSGMRQEVRVEVGVLVRLGELLDPASSETTTPATGGTGPAPVETASQPGGNPVNPAERDSQQDRSTWEREQSSSPAAPPGSPSSGPTDQTEEDHHGQAEDFRHAAPPEHRVRR